MKKYLYIILILPLFLISISTVSAKKLSINDVKDAIEDTYFYKYVLNDGHNQYGDNAYVYTTNLDTENNKLELYKDGSRIMSLNYTTDYIEYDVQEDNIDVDNVLNYAGNDIILYYTIMDAITTLSGFDNQNVDMEKLDQPTYNDHGLSITTQYFDLSDDSTSFQGEIFRHFKMSLDTEKITTLMNEYGVDIDYNPTIDELIKNLTPTIKKDEVGTDYIKIIPKVDNIYSNDTVYCDIYRSEHSSRDYEKVSDEPVKCMGETIFKDYDLDDDTTYYYKAVVENGDNYSDFIEITTDKKDDEDDDDTSTTTTTTGYNSGNTSTDKQEELKNPDTGVFIPLVIVIVSFTLSLGILIYTKKKKLFVRL